MTESRTPTVARVHNSNPQAGTTRRELISAAAGGALAVGLAACGATSSGGSSKKIAFAQPDTSAAIYRPLLRGAQQQANALGYTLLQSHANSQLDRQLSEINDWIAEGIGAIVVLPLDNNAIQPVIHKAHTHGVKFLDYSDNALPGVDGWIIFDNLQGAKLVGTNAGNWVNQTLGGKAKVALLTHQVQLTGRERIGGAVSALKAVAPNVQIVAQQEAVLSAQALPVVQSMLQAHPDLNVIFCIADDGALGALQAFMQTNPSPQRIAKMYIAGWDGSAPAVEKVVAGTALRSTGALDAVGIGKASIAAAHAAIKGTSGSRVSYPYTLITKDTVAQAQKIIAEYK
jgi:ribose transport system substrate-binding protein